jgi:CBS domain containing-hemolysin-like protein
MASLLLGFVAEPTIGRLLEEGLTALGAPDGVAATGGFVVALAFVAFLHMVVGEMVPKNIAIAGPERTALALAPALAGVATAIGPIIRTLNRFANAVVRLTGREPKDEVASAFTREEVADLVAESRREGLLDDEEHQRITSALDFDTTDVSTVMVPDAEVMSVEPGVTAAEIERICARTGFSRFPILEPDGRFSGYLHIRDVIDIPADRRDEPVPPGKIRRLPTVAPDTDLRTALDSMRRLGAHLAEVAVPVAAATGEPAALTVVEPVPGPVASVRGVVMLEDVIEALIGEIRDATRRSPDRAGRRTGADGA